ncbi:MAG TPA: AAA family ATPase [Candidatus Limnocylindrales bacterium]
MSEALESVPLQIPADALVVLVGASGSGKSTFAARWFPAEAILSSDRLRAELTGDPADQSANSLTFRILHAQLERRLAAGRLTVVDATNVTAAARRPLLGRAARFGRSAVLIVLDLPEAACLAHNAARPGRTVPPAAIRRQLASLQADRDRLAGELRPGDQLVVLADPGARAIRLTAAGGQATLSPIGAGPANPAGRSRSRDS